MALVWDCVSSELPSLPPVNPLLTWYLCFFLSSTLFPLSFPFQPGCLSRSSVYLTSTSTSEKLRVLYIYNIYMVLMVLSHTWPHGVLLSYTSKIHPLYCAIHRKSSLSHRLGEDGWGRGSSSPSLGHWGGQNGCPVTLRSYHSLVECFLVFLQKSCCWMRPRKKSAKRIFFYDKEQHRNTRINVKVYIQQQQWF